MKIDRNELIEAVSALENLIHSEYHYIEAISVNNDKVSESAVLIDIMRKVHTTRVEIMEELAKSLPNIGPIWCTIKHLLLTHMSLLETAEKCADPEDVQMFLKYADEIHHIIKDLLFEVDFSGFKECSRCLDDKEQSAEK